MDGIAAVDSDARESLLIEERVPTVLLETHGYNFKETPEGDAIAWRKLQRQGSAAF